MAWIQPPATSSFLPGSVSHHRPTNFKGDRDFFQIINHGIPDSLIFECKQQARPSSNFPFKRRKPTLTKHRIQSVMAAKIRYSSDSEAKLDWGDSYYNTIWPLDTRDMSKWPIQLYDFTEAMDEYSIEFSKLFELLMKALSRDLGLETENSLNESVEGERKELYMRMNHYPPCPQQDLVVGLAPLSDPNVLKILLHDQTPGLQIRKNGAWINVHSVFSYSGCEILLIRWRYSVTGNTRALNTGAWFTRIAQECHWPMFAAPPRDVVVSPRRELIDEEESSIVPVGFIWGVSHQIFQEKIRWKGVMFTRRNNKIHRYPTHDPDVLCRSSFIS